jgi:MFS family permease
MGSLALMPVGYLVAGPLADAFGPRVVLGVGSVIALVLLALALLPRSTRELGGASFSDVPAVQPSSSRAMSV